jgi:hypothetical protein
VLNKAFPADVEVSGFPARVRPRTP